MIHDWDTHDWLARLPDETWISAEDHSSADPCFAEATRIRIEPLHQATVQAILDAEVPPGYTAFLRTDLHVDMGGKLAKLGYILAIEKGQWDKPGYLPIGGFEEGIWTGLPILDGFRAELQTWNGEVAFESSSNFSYEATHENELDVYKFVMR